MQVERTYLVVTRSHGGYVVQTGCWCRREPAPQLEEHYSDLSWSELVDVVLQILDSRRPGTETDESLLWQQMPLDWENRD